jgi:hypothetical protein
MIARRAPDIFADRDAFGLPPPAGRVLAELVY